MGTTKAILLDLEGAIPHRIFKHAKFRSNGQGDQFMCTQIQIPNIQEWEKSILNAPSIRSILLPTSIKIIPFGICGIYKHFQLQYEYYPMTLMNQTKLKSGELFDEQQLWYLAYTLLEVAVLYHRKNLQVGDIRPNNIFLNDDSQIKIVTQHSYPNQLTNYHKYILEKTITCLCTRIVTIVAPEQIDSINHTKLQKSVDFKIAEAFSIGITCLCTALTIDYSLFYNNHNLSINLQVLHTCIAKLNTLKYSTKFCSLISRLCEYNSAFRGTCENMYQWLLPYCNQICNFQPFNLMQPIPHQQMDMHWNLQQNIGQQRRKTNLHLMTPISSINKDHSSQMFNSNSHKKVDFSPISKQWNQQQRQNQRLLQHQIMNATPYQYDRKNLLPNNNSLR